MGNTVEVDLATLDAFMTEMLETDRSAASALVAGAVADDVSLEAVVTGLGKTATGVATGSRWPATPARNPATRSTAMLIAG